MAGLDVHRQELWDVHNLRGTPKSAQEAFGFGPQVALLRVAKGCTVQLPHYAQPLRHDGRHMPHTLPPTLAGMWGEAGVHWHHANLAPPPQALVAAPNQCPQNFSPSCMLSSSIEELDQMWTRWISTISSVEGWGYGEIVYVTFLSAVFVGTIVLEGEKHPVIEI